MTQIYHKQRDQSLSRAQVNQLLREAALAYDRTVAYDSPQKAEDGLQKLMEQIQDEVRDGV